VRAWNFSLVEVWGPKPYLYLCVPRPARYGVKHTTYDPWAVGCYEAQLVERSANKSEVYDAEVTRSNPGIIELFILPAIYHQIERQTLGRQTDLHTIINLELLEAGTLGSPESGKISDESPFRRARFNVSWWNQNKCRFICKLFYNVCFTTFACRPVIL